MEDFWGKVMSAVTVSVISGIIVNLLAFPSLWEVGQAIANSSTLEEQRRLQRVGRQVEEDPACFDPRLVAGSERAAHATVCADEDVLVTVTLPEGQVYHEVLEIGSAARAQLAPGQRAALEITPLSGWSVAAADGSAGRAGVIEVQFQERDFCTRQEGIYIVRRWRDGEICFEDRINMQTGISSAPRQISCENLCNGF